MRRKAKMQARELVSAGWILLITFLLALAISLLLIFPVLFALIMYLPLIVFTKKLWPKYKLILKRYKVYRKITGQRTVEEIENEILARRKAQVQGTVITEK